jgi:hypothetical protein
VTVGVSWIIVRASAREAVDKSGLVTVNVYIPAGTLAGTTAVNIVHDEDEVVSDPYPSSETTDPATNSLPKMVIVFS